MEGKKLTRGLNVVFTDDPFIAVYFKRLYIKNIKGEVDEINIHINGENDEAMEFIRKFWSDEAKSIFVEKKEPATINHGEALNLLWKNNKQDIFVIVDNDNFVYKRGIIEKFCSKIEDGLDYVGGKGPYMCFFRKTLLDKIDVDFRESYEGGKFRDTMKNLLIELYKNTDKTFIIPVDSNEEYEHIGRMSAFPAFINDYKRDNNTRIGRHVLKFFGRPNRVALVKWIYLLTEKNINLEHKKLYWELFLKVCDKVGHYQHNIDKIIKEKYETKSWMR